MRCPSSRRAGSATSRLSDADQAGPAGVAKGLENLDGVRVLARLPLRVPLHRQQEGGEGGGVDRLDQPVFGMGQRLQPLGQRLDTWPCSELTGIDDCPISSASQLPGTSST